MIHAQPTIVGAGLAGLLAACAWPQCKVLEAAPAPRAMHHALLRFRSDAVSRLTGVEFRRVRVRKGIWSAGAFREPSIALANAYSAKVTGRLLNDRSIWDIAPVDRWVAPEDFYERLVDIVGPRIMWGMQADFAGWRNGPAISTAPLPVVLGALNISDHTASTFTFQPIEVQRFRINNADVFQTIYFPDPSTPIYRASITGSLLIVESTAPASLDHLSEVLLAFSVDWAEVREVDRAQQRYGKIAPIDEQARKGMIWRLSHEHGIFSLGRFATWRNILLDDVVDDISVIKRLLVSGAYDRAKTAA